MSETIIFMMGCATSRIPSLDMGCLSLFWTSDGVGHRAAQLFNMKDIGRLGVIRCDGCGFEPDEETQMSMRRILLEYWWNANLDESSANFATSACHIIVRAAEN